MGSEAARPDGARPSRGIGGVLPYVLAVVMAVVLVVVTVSRGGPSDAAKDTLGGKQLKIMAPADPGGGWDSTARAMQATLEDIVGRSEVYNVTGAGGTIGLSQFVNYEGQSNQLMVMGPSAPSSSARARSRAWLVPKRPTTRPRPAYSSRC